MKRKPKFMPGGEKGKLHEELGVPKGEKIPAQRLASAMHARDPEVRRDAVRAKTMEGWHHGGKHRKAILIHTTSHKE